MFARKEWFKRRKYGGWGVTPKTWQGYVYIAAVVVPLIVFQSFQFWTEHMRIAVTLGWLGFLFIDMLPIMITMKKDEFEKKAEAISERNAAWFMMLVLVIGVLYQAISSALTQDLFIDWFLVAALIGGALVKSVSNIYFDRKGIN